ncbi:MAG: arsenate reductase (glutaredoxin) [Pseudomonadales bacterium]|jgi:arsenate reductase|nr:arsenate reductase (glutaredoxin) [Pseudomonadales bacterium]
MTTVTIFHNPRCSKSRETLALLEGKGISPEIRLYLENPLTKEELKQILDQLDVSPRGLIRASEAAYKEQNLKNAKLSDDELIDAMVATPKLIQRPIVVVNDKAALGRPPEQVLEIL